MTQYSVLLAYPSWSIDWEGPETFYTYVTAHTVEAAIDEAKKECCAGSSGDLMGPDDLTVLLVIQGWHADIKS